MIEWKKKSFFITFPGRSKAVNDFHSPRTYKIFAFPKYLYFHKSDMILYRIIDETITPCVLILCCLTYYDTACLKEVNFGPVNQ